VVCATSMLVAMFTMTTATVIGGRHNFCLRHHYSREPGNKDMITNTKPRKFMVRKMHYHMMNRKICPSVNKDK